MDQKSIGEFITTKRKERNLTQKELAEKLGISEKTISKWETGHGLPEVSNMQPLCKELDITVTELLNGKESEKIKEDKVIEYIEYKDKRNKLKLIITIAIMIILLIIAIFGIYFINNFGKTTVYKLDGESEHFSYHNATITISNIRNILTAGNFEQIGDLGEIVILETKLMYRDQLIASNSFINGQIKLIQEDNGYNEIFTKEKLDNLKDWYINILYLKEDKVYEEKIELTATKILKNNEFFHKTLTPIGENNKQERKDSNNEYQVATRQREKLLKEGYKQIGDKYFALQKKTKKEEITISLGKRRTSYIRYIYKDEEGNSRIIQHLPIDGLEHISVSAKQDGENYDYSFDLKSNKAECLYGKCPNDIWEEGKEFYTRFNNLISLNED